MMISMRIMWVLAVCAAFGLGCADDRRAGRTSDAGHSSTDTGFGVDTGEDASTRDTGQAPFIPSVDALDPSFGSGGMVTAAGASGSLSALWDVVVQPDGKLVGFGRNFEGMVVVRVMPGGELDAGFGSGGYKFLPFGQAQSSFQYHEGSVALAGDGGVLIASYFYPIASSLPQMIVVKLKANGELDTQFADAGIYAPASQSLASKALSIVTQSDGKIIVGASDNGAVILRLSAAGVLDPEFGVDGQMNPGLSTGFQFGHSIAAMPDDRLILAGQHCCNPGAGLAVARLTPDGALDQAFGDGTGVATDAHPVRGQALGNAVALAPDGSIYLVGMRPLLEEEEGTALAVGRFLADGVPDPGFGDAGWVTDRGPSAQAFDAVAQADGKVVAVGYASWPGYAPASMTRLDSQGALDPSFSEDGVFGSNMNDTLGVALQPDQKIVSVGLSGFRRLLPDGTHDPGFASPPLQAGRRVQRATALAIQADGKIVVAGHGAVSGGTTITRFSAQGDVDATFGDWQGSYFGLSGPSTPHRIDLDSQGRIFVGGLSTPSSPIGFDVTRLESDGLPSEDFGSEPFAAGLLLQADFAQTRAMLLVDDEHLYLGGFFRANEGFYMGVMRLDTAGEIDPNWGQDGLVFMPLEADMIGGADPMQLLAMPDGDLLVAGDNRLLRFDTHGVLVASFGEQGIVEGAGALAAMGADGERVVVVAMAPESDEMETGVTRLQVRRHLADGRLDAGFAQAGVATFEVRTMANLPIGLALGSDGAITVGSATGNRLRQQATLFRWGADGRPDAGFGDAGRMVMELSPHSSAFHALALDASGQLMAAGSSWSVEGGSDFALVRLR